MKTNNLIYIFAILLILPANYQKLSAKSKNNTFKTRRNDEIKSKTSKLHLTGTGTGRIVNRQIFSERQFAIDTAKANARLNLRKKLYRSVATNGELFGIFIVKNNNVTPVLNKIINEATFARSVTILPDIIEISCTIQTQSIQKLIAPVILGKQPNLIEFSTDNLVLNPHSLAKKSTDDKKERERIIVTTIAGSKCTPSLFPAILCHNHEITLNMQQKLATYIIENGCVEYRHRGKHNQSTKSFRTTKNENNTLHLTADSIGGLNNTMIYLTDKDGEAIITKIANLKSPENSIIKIIID